MYELDHIVHFVDNPEQAIEEMTAQGLHVVKGGHHEQWGTYNALSYFGSQYIEFIGIEDENKFEKAAKMPYTLHETYEKSNRINGIIRLAIRTTTIQQDADMFSAAGLEVYGPEHFSRTRPDGSVVSWQLLHIGHKSQTVPFPFFIQWDKSNEEREQENKERGITGTHSVGNVKLKEIVYLIDRLDYPKYLQLLEGVKAEEHYDEEINANIVTLHLHNIDLKFVCPCGDGPAWDAMLTSEMGINYITFAGAETEKIIEYENGQYVFVK
ncbi:VOC family protein [Solibacillus sp. CAU 1738]|uniref:VOC family protein n=1 Tax=Solibacillus sp. CAU 1738 TaxID=3140363 RepID=UPI00325FF4A8